MQRSLQVAIWIVLLGLCAAWLYVSSDEYLRQILKTTVFLSLQVTCITVPLGIVLATALSRTNLPGGRIWPFLCASLLILPSFVLISGWDAVIGPIGWAKSWFPASISLVAVRWWSAVLLHSLLALPGVILILSLGLTRPDTELEEVGLLQWPWPMVLLRVTLRRAAPLLVSCALWIFVTVSGEIAVTDIYQIRTVAEEIYLSTGASSTGTGEFPYQGILPFLFLTGIASLLALSLADGVLRTDGVVTHRCVIRFSLGAVKWPIAILVAMICLTLLLIPLASLIYKAGLHVQYPQGGRPFQTWSLEHTSGTLLRAPENFAKEIYWTFLHAFLGGAMTLFIAVGLAWLERCRPSFKIVISILIVVAIAIPGPLVGIGLLKLLSGAGSIGVSLRDRTLFGPIAASALRALPWIVLLLRYSFQTIPQEQLEVARLEGWGVIRSLFAIALPQRWAMLAASLLFSAAICLSDVSTNLLVTPPGVELASVRMMGMLHSGVDNQLAGLALLLGAIYALALIPLALLLRLAHRNA